MLAAALSASCGLGTGKLGRPKLPTTEVRGLVHLTQPQIQKGRRETETQRETERCRVGPFLAVRSGAPQLLVRQLQKSQGGDYQGKQLMSLRTRDALPRTPRHCWPHIQGGVTPPPPKWMPPRQLVCLLQTCPSSHSSLALGSRMVPHILFPGSPCLGPWVQGMNVCLTESLRWCPSPKAASFCELGFANEEECQPVFLLIHIQFTHQGSFIPTSSI